MILKPFKVHSPDGKTFYEGDAPKTLSDDLTHEKAVMEGRTPVFGCVDGVAQDDERTAFIRAYMAARPASVAQAGNVFDQDWHGKQMWSAGIAYARAASPQPVAQPVEQTRALTVTPAMVKAAMPWLTSLHHMRKTDKESYVEEAIKAAMTAARLASGETE